MKIKLTAVALAVAGLFAVQAQAGTYMGIHGGGSSVSVGKIDNGATDPNSYTNGAFRKGSGSAGVVLGYDFYPSGYPIRTEIDYTFRNNVNKNSAKVGLQTVMMNTVYDITTGSKFTPYVGVGVGYANVKVTNPAIEVKFDGEGNVDDIWQGNISHRTGQFAYGALAGVRYAASDSVDIDFGYRYIDAGKAKVAGYQAGVLGNKVRVNTNDVVFGVNYSF